MPHYYRNTATSALLQIAYGNKGTVALPDNDTTHGFERGPFPPGVSEVLQVLEEQCRDAAANGPKNVDWVFLVGGPGNGKSEALKYFAKQLGLAITTTKEDEPAPRLLPPSWPASGYKIGSVEVLLINDATIPRADIQPDGVGSLFLDLREARARIEQTPSVPVCILANVNRGVLIEELHRLPSGESNELDSKIVSILKWLAGQDGGFDYIDEVVSGTPTAPYYRLCNLAAGSLGRECRVHAVFLDTLSLLEPSPKGLDGCIAFEDGTATIASYVPLGKLAANRMLTIAGDRLRDIVKISRWEQGGCSNGTSACTALPRCPFVQNARWLRNKDLSNRFLSVMRAAEIAGARRFTYRDLLAHISLAILGRPAESWLKSQHPCDWVANNDKQIANNEPEQASACVRLIGRRVYANLFSSCDSATWKPLGQLLQKSPPLYSSVRALRDGTSGPSRPRIFEEAFDQLDPAKDCREWQKNVFDVLEAQDVLIDVTDEAAAMTGVDPDALCELETRVDRALADELSNALNGKTNADASRRAALKLWRSVLLLRQVGLATGEMRNGDVLSAWLEEHAGALAGAEAATTSIGHGLAQLIVTSCRVSNTDRLVLAPTRSRTHALNKLPNETIITLIDANKIHVTPTAYGDSLEAEVALLAGHTFEKRAAFVVDLAVAREAYVQHQSRTLAFTEIPMSAFSRIERTRAALVSRGRVAKLEMALVDDRGNLRFLTGSLPFRFK